MSFISRLKSLNPIAKIDNAVRDAIEDKTHAAFAAAADDLAKLSPEMADLIAGEPVELEITVKATIQLRQKGEK